jgi:hypothetical protein
LLKFSPFAFFSFLFLSPIAPFQWVESVLSRTKIFMPLCPPRAEPMGIHRCSEVFNSSISLVVRRHDFEGTTGSAFQQEIVAIPRPGHPMLQGRRLRRFIRSRKDAGLERGGGEAGVRLLRLGGGQRA